MSIDLFDYIVGKVLEIVPGPKAREINVLKFRCPFCGDSKKFKSKKRGYLYRGKERPSFHCFNCQANLGPYAFLCKLENKQLSEVKRDIAVLYTNAFKDRGLLKLLDDSLDQADRLTEQQDEPLQQRSTIDLHENWVPLEQDSHASTLIKNRRVLEAPFAPDNWRLYYDKGQNRIVIPWVRGGEIVYYQHRSIVKSSMKYVFPPDLKKDVFGLDSLDRSFPYIFVTEGVFDAIWVKNCVAIGGIYPTSYQMEIMEPYLFGMQMVFIPDNPWVDQSAAENLMKVAKRDPKSLVFRWPPRHRYKDINQEVVKTGNLDRYADTELLQSRITSAVKMKIELKFKG